MLPPLKLPPSDHLPVFITVKAIPMVTWNLLSDQHLHNKFLSVRGTKYFNRYLSKKLKNYQIDWRFFFSKFSNFVLANSAQIKEIYQITLTPSLLLSFVDYQQQQILNLENTIDRTINLEELPIILKKEKDTLNAFKELIPLILDTTHVNHQNIKTLLIRMMRTNYMIEYYDKWKIRLENFKDNKVLIDSLLSQDFLCFQECTSPNDVFNLLTNAAKEKGLNKHFTMLSHRMNDKSTDHCVIIYDQKKYHLLSHYNFGLLLDNKTKKYRKPCILAQFLSKDDQKLLVGSVHHPGGGRNEIQSILNAIYQILNTSQPSIDCVVLGDYNHTPRFFEEALSDTAFSVIMPVKGTMVGSDFGNSNVAIDGVLTNRPENITVEISEKLKFAKQPELPLNIQFDF